MYIINSTVPSDILLFLCFINLSHHTWCSFEGAAEVYNEMVRLTYLENATNTAKFLSLCSLRVTGKTDNAQNEIICNKAIIIITTINICICIHRNFGEEQCRRHRLSAI